MPRMSGQPRGIVGAAYNIAEVGDNDAEINMYGEVVDNLPIDWWTGEPVPGDFIAVDQFLKDLDGLKTKNNITIHINSVGGSLYGGIAIYNRLKDLPANITTINDGLAASAGSIIFQAGDTRKVNTGSNLMVHPASGLLFGYYKSSDLKNVMKQLDAGTKAAVNVYAEKSGRSADEIKPIVDRETWYTGQEAVDAGFADEVIDSGVQIQMCMTPDRSAIMCNGITMSARSLGNIPQTIPTMSAEQFAAFMASKNTVSAPEAPRDGIEHQIQTGGKNTMENQITIKRVDDLRAAYPDLVAQIESAAQAQGMTEGAANERARIQGIENIAGAIADQQMLADAKFGDKPLTAQELAFAAMQKQAKIGATVLNQMQTDAQNSGAAAVTASANAGASGNHEPTSEELAKQTVDLYNKLKGGTK